MEIEKSKQNYKIYLNNKNDSNVQTLGKRG